MSKGLPRGAKLVQHHMTQCPKCRDNEYWEVKLIDGLFVMQWYLFTCYKCSRVWYQEARSK